MTYPLIDITRPVRFTDYGRNLVTDYGRNLESTESASYTVEKNDSNYYSLTIRVGPYVRRFTDDGFWLRDDDLPCIENIPEETKMPNLIDPARPVKYRFIDNGSKFEFLMTIKNEYYPHVFKSTNGNGYENVAQYSERGECVIKNMHDQLDIENIPQDTEPPEEIFNAWRAGYICVTGFKPNEDKMWRSSQTYSDWKNKKITVEDSK